MRPAPGRIRTRTRTARAHELWLLHKGPPISQIFFYRLTLSLGRGLLLVGPR